MDNCLLAITYICVGDVEVELLAPFEIWRCPTQTFYAIAAYRAGVVHVDIVKSLDQSQRSKYDSKELHLSCRTNFKLAVSATQKHRFQREGGVNASD